MQEPLDKIVEVIKTIQKGQWIFTCSMKPLQFGQFNTRNPKDYARKFFDDDSEDEKLVFLFDQFDTFDGSGHSIKNCGCKPISIEYAKWFIEYEVWELYEASKDFKIYEHTVKDLCIQQNIMYEGI